MAKVIRAPKRKTTVTRVRRQQPVIELYLSKINQEQIKDVGRVGACDFYASWKKSCCVLDFSMVRPEDLVSNPAKGFLLRKEPEGGMMWNPRTGAVYKLNETAYHAMLDFENGLGERTVALRNNMSLPSAQAMLKKLQKIS